MTEQERYEAMYDKIVDLKNEIKHKDDLINRQKAEIARLNSRKEVVVPSMRLIDGNPLNGFNLESHRFVARTVEDVKAEAYKEFSEILKEHKCSYDLDNYHSFEAVEINIIDEILREKAGDDDA